MKKSLVFIILFLSLPAVLADWYINSESIVANISIKGGADIVYYSANGYIKSASVNMTFFPRRTFTQEQIRFATSPQAEAANNQIVFSWDNPKEKLNFGLDAIIRVKKETAKIYKKIDFPILSLPSEVVPYTKPSPTIDSNEDGIIKLGSELAKGDDDLYSVVFKIADWTKNNVRYNLSTLTADVSEKASWVLQNRYGVCDEITSLFIALLRSVGIPARFVSGISYTNSELFSKSWVPHGWAEVYFQITAGFRLM